MENFSDAVVIQYDGKIIWVNSKASCLLGKDQSELEGTDFLDLFPADQKEIIKKKYINEIKKTKSINVHEFDLLSADKMLLPIEMIAILSEFGGNPAVTCMIRNISGRKKMEETLKQSENLYRTLVETLQDGLSIMDLEGKILFCNQKKAEMFRYRNPEELTGKNGFDLIVPKERDRALLMIQKLLNHGIIKNQEFTVIRKDGSLFPAEFSASLLRDDSGSPFQIVDIMRDITDRKQDEQTIRENEKRYRESMENSPNPIFAVNKDGIIEIWNAACEDIFQYTKDQMIGRAHHKHLWESKELQSIQAKINRVWNGDIINNEEFSFVCKNGNLRYTVSRLYPLHDQDDQVQLCVFANTDITERKKMEEDLRSEYSFRAGIIDSAAEGLCVCHEIKDFPYIKFTVWNDRMTEITGYSMEEINRFGWYQTMYPDLEIQGRVIARMNRMRKGDDIRGEEWEITCADGQKRTITISTSLLTSRGGKNHVLALMHDITERRLAEEQMKASLKEKEVLLQEIHHRVKNNMQIISSLLNLQSSALKDEKVVGLFTESRNRIRSMALIHEKLYQSQNLARINFGEYIQTLTTHLFHTYKVDPSSVALKTELQDVCLDINMAIPCSLIVNELVSNSLKHAFPKQKKGEIRIKLEENEKGKKIMSLSDNGIGFTQDYDPKNPKTLGLQIVHDLIHQINGELDFQGKKGTLFRIEF